MYYFSEQGLLFSSFGKRKINALCKIMTLEEAYAYDNYVTRKLRVSRSGRTSTTDSQRSKTYRAEFKFQKAYHGKTFSSEKEVERYLNKIKRSKTWSNLGGRDDVRLRFKKDLGGRSASAGLAYPDGTIALCPTWGMNEYVLLHEMAHQCGHMHHDVSFRACLLKLVSRFMGVEEAKYLKQCFKDEKLRLTLNTNIKEPEKWLVSYRRMKSVRSARRGR